MRRSIGRYFFEQQTSRHPDQARLDKGTLGDADTTWQAFWSSQPAGCASNNPYTLLARPILSARQIDRWINLSATVIDNSDSTWIVNAADTFFNAVDSSLIPATFSYTIDKRSGCITRLNVVGDYLLQLASFFYDTTGPTPLLSRIALSTTDTSLTYGGFVFSNIQINASLSDSLFIVAIRNPLVRGGAAPVSIGGRSVLEFDAMGRMISATFDHSRESAGIRLFVQPSAASGRGGSLGEVRLRPAKAQ